MQIGIVAGPHIPIPHAKYGGSELIINYLIRGLKEAGHTPILFAPGDSTADCEVIPICQKSIYFPRDPKQLATHNRLKHKANAETNIQLRKNLHRLDIIHSHDFDLINFSNFPNLTTIHGAINFRSLPYYLERRDLFYASISKNQQNACPDLRYVGVIYNGEDPDEFPIVEEPENYLCFLGRLDEEKSPHFAIELAISLNMPIKLAGKVDLQGSEYFERKIKPLLKNPLVEFLGELNFAEKTKLLAHAKCNLHPTGFREPFGLSIVEAAYCGTPTLAIARGSIPELIKPERTGILTEDFVEGYHKITKCFQMNRRYIAQHARQRFNYKTMTEQYIKAYKKVIGSFAASHP